MLCFGGWVILRSSETVVDDAASKTSGLLVAVDNRIAQLEALYHKVGGAIAPRS